VPAARAHALDMLERGYFDHVTPRGLDPSDRVALLHRWLVGGVGENLAEHRGLSTKQLEGQVGPLAVEIMDGLIQSSAHRENILNPKYTPLAIAAVAKGEGLVVVQLFEARRALLAEQLPLHARRGEKLPLKFEQGQGLAVPTYYAYARPGQSVQELVALDLSSDEVAVEPAVYFSQVPLSDRKERSLRCSGRPGDLRSIDLVRLAANISSRRSSTGGSRRDSGWRICWGMGRCIERSSERVGALARWRKRREGTYPENRSFARQPIKRLSNELAAF
jgi:hypothetical protein